MLHDAGHDGIFLYLYRSRDDGASFADSWFETLGLALESARLRYGIGPRDWEPIPDPLPDCLHDRVAQSEIRQSIDLPAWDEGHRFRISSPRLIQPAGATDFAREVLEAPDGSERSDPNP
jgi:hypothetical protein